MIECDRFRPFMDRLPGVFRGITPHIMWHFAAGYASYCGIICLSCCRMEELSIVYKVKYWCGIVPTFVNDAHCTPIIDIK